MPQMSVQYDAETVGLLFRGCERLIVVGAGALAIWLGYRLFDRVVSDKGAFEGKIGEWQIKLQRVAPGVFFALFGASILVVALGFPIPSRCECPRQHYNNRDNNRPVSQPRDCLDRAKRSEGRDRRNLELTQFAEQVRGA